MSATPSGFLIGGLVPNSQSIRDLHYSSLLKAFGVIQAAR